MSCGRSDLSAITVDDRCATVRLSEAHFPSSTAPQAFPRPDRRMPTPPRAAPVKTGRSSAAAVGLVLTGASTVAGSSCRAAALLLGQWERGSAKCSSARSLSSHRRPALSVSSRSSSAPWDRYPNGPRPAGCCRGLYHKRGGRRGSGARPSIGRAVGPGRGPLRAAGRPGSEDRCR